MRRTRRRFALELLGCAGWSAMLAAGAPVRFAFGQEARRATGGPPGRSERLILLGTQGGPNYRPERGETASAVVVDGIPYLVDCGYGTLGALVESGLGYLGVAQIFLTHLHDDHTADLAALLGRQWTSGRVEPTTVHGPFGTRALVDAAIEFGAANAAIRMLDEDRSVQPRDLFRAVEVQASRAPLDVFEDERVTVTAAENTHFPESARERMPYRSIAYRFETPTRSIVFAGDTAYSEALVTLARDADVLVCETIDIAAQRRAFDAKVAAGAYADNPEGIWQHIVETHTSTEDAGRMADEAGVRMLVLNHIVPGALSDLPDEAYIAGVRKRFAGEVVVGRDFMEL